MENTKTCPWCTQPYNVAKAYTIYRKGTFYEGHKYCMNALFTELEYPRENSVDKTGNAW